MRLLLYVTYCHWARPHNCSVWRVVPVAVVPPDHATGQINAKTDAGVRIHTSGSGFKLVGKRAYGTGFGATREPAFSRNADWLSPAGLRAAHSRLTSR